MKKNKLEFKTRYLQKSKQTTHTSVFTTKLQSYYYYYYYPIYRKPVIIMITKSLSSFCNR